jgi:GDPmannose 4,6-dehydratase
LSLIAELKPNELYNMAAQSDVRLSFDIPEYTGNATGLGVTRILEAVRKFSPDTKTLQASSSEMFGNVAPPQNEQGPFNPQNPYACAKLYAFNMCRIYRKAYNLYIANSICLNHESERRGLNFVTRKITNGVAQIVAGKVDYIGLGNLDAKRDWGYAPEYVEAMWQMLQHGTPDDFVIATGETHTVRDFVEAAFACVELDWHKFVKLDTNALRPTETHYLQGDIRKAVTELGWRPKVTFKELVRKMVEHDLKLAGVKMAVK